MSLNIVDKRPINRDRTSENRQRFLRRIKQTIKDQIPNIVRNRSIKEIEQGGGNIVVKRKSIDEPTIHHGQGGDIDTVLPGNEHWVEGDLIDKPSGSGGSGGSGRQAGTGESQDEFIVEISREEFLNYFFEDLELPDMMETQLSKIKQTVRENAGFQTDGSPNRLSVIRSYKQSLARRLPLTKKYDTMIKELEVQISFLRGGSKAIKILNGYFVYDPKEGKIVEREVKNYDGQEETLAKFIAEVEESIELIKRKRDDLPMFEDMDLRYRTTVKREIPMAHATMIMIMDNSGSMGLKEKTIARKFFWLLYRFLKTEYDEVEIIPISHTESATIMTEREFFETRDSGGTLVSSALELVRQTIHDGISSSPIGAIQALKNRTNIYVAQVSDGDNMDTDNGTCSEILEDDILPHVRYYSYVQVDDYHGDSDESNQLNLLAGFGARGLWKSYQNLSDRVKKMQIKRVYQERDIYPVFRQLFEKKIK